MLGYHRSANRYIGALDSSNEPRAPSWQHGVGTLVDNTGGFGALPGPHHGRRRHKRHGHKLGHPPALGDLEGIWGALMQHRTEGGFPMVHKGFHLGRPPGAHGNTGPGAAGMPGKDPPPGGFRFGGKNFSGGKPSAHLYTHHLAQAGVKTRKHLGFVPRSHPPTRASLPMSNPMMMSDPMLSDPMLSGLEGPYTSTVTTFGGAMDDIVSVGSSVLDAANAKADKLQNALYLIIGLSGIAALTGVVTIFRRR